MGIDKYVVKILDEFLNTYTKYIENFLSNENTTLLKYEDMIFEFETWLRKVLNSFSFLDKGAKMLFSGLFLRYKDEFVIKKENPFNHKRKIIPGDYKEKPSVSTVELLNKKFSYVLDKLDYKRV